MPGIAKPLTKPQAKRLAQSLSPATVKSMKIDLSLFDAENNEEYCTCPKRALSGLGNRVNRTTRQRKATARGPRRQYGRHCRIGNHEEEDDEDGLSLARSDVPLPGDADGACRDLRKPRLERQEAFRGSSVGGGFVSSDDVVENDADLYRLGLLYDDDGGDDEGNRGPGFTLDAIVHDEPVYAVRLSRRKQKKRGNNNSQTAGTPLHVIYESVEDSLFSIGPFSQEGYFYGEEDGEDWSFIPLLEPHGSGTTADTVSIDSVTTPSTEAWVVLDGA